MINTSRMVMLVAVSMLLQLPVFAQQQISSKVKVQWNRFYDVPEIESLLKELVNAYPELLTIQSIGKSEQGRELWVVTLNNDKTGNDESKPAMWIDGAVHANEIQAAETTLYSIWYLASAYGQVKSLTELVDRTAFYFLPMVNPDGRSAWFNTPTTSSMYRSGMRPTDNDRDGRVDEDGPDDLSETSSIHVMWRKDPHGGYRRS
jgi:murein tripeptide amidase MpaA